MKCVWMVSVLALLSACERLPDHGDLELRAGDNMSNGIRITKSVQTWQDIRTRNTVMQNFDYSCGAAAMATLLTYYFNDSVTEREILQNMISSLNEEEMAIRRRQGFSMLDLKQYAERRGYIAVGVRLEFPSLTRLRGPILVFLELTESQHFAILKGVREDRVFLSDPSRGNIQEPIFRFMQEWHGIALVLGRTGFGTPEQYPLAVDRNAPFRTELEDARLGMDAFFLPVPEMSSLFNRNRAAISIAPR